MSEDGKFTETGLKNLETVAGITAAETPVIGWVIGAAAFIAGVINWFSGDDTSSRIAELQTQLTALRAALDQLSDRINALAVQAAVTANRDTFRALMDNTDQIRLAVAEIQHTDANRRIALAGQLGVVADRFIRPTVDGYPYDLFLWMDVGDKPAVDENGAPILDANGVQRMDKVPVPNQFKNLPTLPFYLLAVTAWLGARELVIDDGNDASLDDDLGRLDRHLAATRVRPDFHNFELHLNINAPLPLPGNPDTLSLAELVMLLVVAEIVVETRYPENGQCRYHFVGRNYMTGGDFPANEVITYPQADKNAMCMPSADQAPPESEIEAQAAAGTKAIAAVWTLLNNARTTGRAGGQRVSPFFVGAIPYPEQFYVVKFDGAVDWFELLPSVNQPNVVGPRAVVASGASGWTRFKTVVPGGGPVFYGVQPDGHLIWMRHDGVSTGAPQWSERLVGYGWANFQRLIPGGNGVIYAVRQDGAMLWYRHNGTVDGDDFSTWAAPVELERPSLLRYLSAPRPGGGVVEVPVSEPPRPWTSFAHIMCMGRGILYVVTPEGDLHWLLHEGAADGRAAVSGGQRVGTGWASFQTLIASPPGRIYAIKPDGEMLYYLHAGWQTGDITPWNTPVTLGNGWAGQRQVLVLAIRDPSVL
jgi:hypothetical protein